MTEDEYSYVIEKWFVDDQQEWYLGESNGWFAPLFDGWYPLRCEKGEDLDYQDFVLELPITVFYLQEMVEVGDFYSRVIVEVMIEEEEVQ